ncbi:MAG: hypothetical protein IPL53_19995 [Ignavibacteria bacterium]|nr:hypothetical protein [Ignavibacteria bacterium]
MVIRIFHLFSHEKNDLVEDVLYRPEVYINAINYTLIFFNSLGLYLMGLVIFSVKKNIFISMFFQTIPFVSINITEVFSLVKTETFVFFFAAILISIMFKLVYDPPERINNYAIFTGILCGLILATKISFMSLILIPLILLPGLKNKILFISLTGLSFIVFVLPAISNLDYFISWVMRLIFNDGRYGQGNPSIINPESFLNNIAKIFVNEKFFAAVYVLTLAVLAISLFMRKNVDSQWANKQNEIKFLLSIFLAMSLQIIMVAKHYSHRYMYPALILTIPSLYIIMNILYRKYFTKMNANIVFGSILIFTLLFCAYNGRKLYARAKTKAVECLKTEQYVNKNYPNAEVILSSGTTNEYTGLILSYFYSGENVKPVYLKHINKRFPDMIWYDIFYDHIYSLAKPFDIKEQLQSGKTVLLQTMDETYNKKFIENLKMKYDIENIRLAEVFSNTNGEKLFQVTF